MAAPYTHYPDEVRAAIQVLEDAGRSHFLPQYQATADRWECIALGMTTVEDDCAGMIRAAYAFLEDWNYHRENEALQAALPWAFPGETENVAGQPEHCECDNTHEAVDSVCRWCYAHGRRHWDDPEAKEA